jgi:hypothetical protein
MGSDSSRWTEITSTQFPWEREALDYVRERLPDHDPYRAFALFEFIASDGSINEVDLLAIAPTGIYLVEIKSWPGVVSGDQRDWVREQEGRRPRYEENPLLGAALGACPTDRRFRLGGRDHLCRALLLRSDGQEGVLVRCGWNGRHRRM